MKTTNKIKVRLTCWICGKVATKIINKSKNGTLDLQYECDNHNDAEPTTCGHMRKDHTHRKPCV
jgi:hypothetical protein